MVILGAGASFDSVPLHSWSPNMLAGVNPGYMNYQPPLANRLFDNRPNFAAVVARFPRMVAVVPRLRRAMQDSAFSLERELLRIQEEADAYPLHHKALLAIRFYLQQILWECGREWRAESKGATNYADLLTEIDRRLGPQDRSCIVSFNYDLLVENAFEDVFGHNFASTSDYLDLGKWDIVKLHGSVNWSRPVTVANDAHLDADAARNLLIEQAPDIRPGEWELRSPDKPKDSTRASVIYEPALSIPVDRKSEFECPPSHLERLTELLPAVTRILVVGWRASEFNFLEMLTPLRGRTDVRWLLVNGGADQSSPTISNLCEVGLNTNLQTFEGGFTDLLASEYLTALLAV